MAENCKCHRNIDGSFIIDLRCPTHSRISLRWLQKRPSKKSSRGPKALRYMLRNEIPAGTLNQLMQLQKSLPTIVEKQQQRP